MLLSVKSAAIPEQLLRTSIHAPENVLFLRSDGKHYLDNDGDRCMPHKAAKLERMLLQVSTDGMCKGRAMALIYYRKSRGEIGYTDLGGDLVDDVELPTIVCKVCGGECNDDVLCFKCGDRPRDPVRALSSGPLL